MADDVPDHGACAYCGKDVRHVFPWLIRTMGLSLPLHDECAREVLFGDKHLDFTAYAAAEEPDRPDAVVGG